MKKSTIIILCIILFCGLVLYLIKVRMLDQEMNSFSRAILKNRIALMNVSKLPDASFGFAGNLDSTILLNKYSDRFHLFKADYSLSQIDTIQIPFSIKFKSSTPNVYKIINSPNIYITNRLGDILIFNKQVKATYQYKSSTFDVFQALSPNSLIVRSRYTNFGSQNRSLSKLILTDTVSRYKEYTLPPTKEGLFRNDGILHYDKENNRILYMYFYKGRFLSLDTNLNFQYDSKTIDTVETAQLNIRLIENKKKALKQGVKVISQQKPPRFVNSYITTYKDNVYISSRLKADNETQAVFRNNQPIDTYDINTGKYKYSFYIPKYNRENVRQFQIKGNCLVAIYTDHIATYNLIDKQTSIDFK